MKINNVNTQYEIPGFDITPQAFEPDESGEDFADAPYSLDPAISSFPSPGGWQQLLGLTEIFPTATSIDPPTRQMTGEWNSKATAAYRILPGADSGQRQSSALSPNVKRMHALFLNREKDLAKIRMRAEAFSL
jgi:hypothetical protein